MLFAHRGSTVLAPENTSMAFDLAIEFEADVLEIDVRLSRDGHVIVTHDEHVDRTTDGNGAVAAMTLQQLKKLDAGYRFTDPEGNTTRGHGIELMTLDEVFEHYPNTGINIDIKDNSIEAASAVASVIERFPDAPWLNVGSFHARAIIHFRHIAPAVSTAAIRSEVARLYFGDMAASTRNINKTLPFQCLQIPGQYFGLSLATASFIKRTKRRGIDVIYWTINDPQYMRILLQRGADGIVTDRVDLALEVFRDLGLK